MEGSSRDRFGRAEGEPPLPEEAKTFKAYGAHCTRPFHVRFPVAAPGEEGKTRVVVSGQYCIKAVAIEIPGACIEEDHLLTGIAGDPA
jgi:hypothetical protein